MITATISLGMHLILSSYQGVRAVGRVLGYAYSTTTMALQGKVDVNTKHLQKGDPLPPFTGKLRVYNMRFCPFAQRTILALNAKNLDYEVVNIDLVDKPEWLTEKSPFGKVPAIEVKEGECVYESLVTAEYLDDVFPERPLQNKDPLKKAFDKIIIEVFGSSIHPVFFKLLKAPDTVTEENITAYHKGLAFVEEQLKSRGSTFLDGEVPGFADYMIWPWLERLLAFDSDERVNITASKYASLVVYIENMLKDPAVSQYALTTEIHKRFFKSYLSGKPDYGILNKN